MTDAEACYPEWFAEVQAGPRTYFDEIFWDERRTEPDGAWGSITWITDGYLADLLSCTTSRSLKAALQVERYRREMQARTPLSVFGLIRQALKAPI